MLQTADADSQSRGAMTRKTLAHRVAERTMIWRCIADIATQPEVVRGVQ
jgi:hypothetical protein